MGKLTTADTGCETERKQLGWDRVHLVWFASWEGEYTRVRSDCANEALERTG